MPPPRLVRTTARLARNAASEIEWVTKTTVIPRVCHNSRSWISRRKRVISSSAANGSSSSSRRGCGHQGARQRHAHPHAAGELRRIAVLGFEETHLLERRSRRRVAFASRPRPSAPAAARRYRARCATAAGARPETRTRFGTALRVESRCVRRRARPAARSCAAAWICRIRMVPGWPRTRRRRFRDPCPRSRPACRRPCARLGDAERRRRSGCRARPYFTTVLATAWLS